MNDANITSSEFAIKYMWGLAGDAGPLNLPDDARNTAISALRNYATLLEKSPQLAVGLVLVTAEQVAGDEEGVGVSFSVLGSSPAVAAVYSMLEKHGQDAIAEVLPAVLSDMVKKFTKGEKDSV
jgi:predicted small lipoprotein YifL